MTLQTPQLQDLVEFPALIPIKAVSVKGTAAETFAAELLDLTARIVPGFNCDLITLRASSAGHYYSATLSITFQNIEQFHAIDAALKAHPLVRMVL